MKGLTKYITLIWKEDSLQAPHPKPFRTFIGCTNRATREKASNILLVFNLLIDISFF